MTARAGEAAYVDEGADVGLGERLEELVRRASAVSDRENRHASGEE
jgi:hypothetical protein